MIEQWRRANERKNVVITTLAHELRNPLASMATSLAILDQTGNQSEDCRFARATIRRQLDQMRRMIDDLLEVAKADRGKIRLDKKELSLNEIMATAVESCRSSIDRQTHNLELLMPDQPIIVSADSDRLRQVFVNLIKNSAKFTSYGGNNWVKVAVEGNHAVVKVEDAGIGISAEMMPRIFDLFTQAEFDSQSTGLGIGLSLVKDLTSLHGGTVQVRSDGLGKGSEFTVRLPLAGADSTRPDSPVVSNT